MTSSQSTSLPPPLIPMPTPSTTQSPLPHQRHHPLPSRYVPPVAACGGALSIILALLLLCRKISRSRTAPADSKPPHRFSYYTLRRATSSFAASRRLGQGGFGSVYRGTLPSGQQIAVKSMDSGSLQGEREFQNELFVAGKMDSEYIVSVLGFASKRQRMVLVYEYMCNGSLQDALLHHKCVQLRDWKKRYGIALDVAKGIEYLHRCDPPIIHGDIKPSNILLDENFRAKIGDFGLATVKSEDTVVVVVVEEGGPAKTNGGSEGKKEELESVGGNGLEDNGSVFEETESVITTTGFEEISVGVDRSPESLVRVPCVEASPETGEAVVVAVSPETFVGAASVESLEKMSASERNFDGVSVESGKEMVSGGWRQSSKGKRSVSGRDWWWPQNNAAAETGVVKDYVMDWIGTEIKSERPKSDWTGASSSSGTILKAERKKNRRRLEWWVSLDEDKNLKKDKRRPAREWWKEEYCEELTRKKKKKKRQKGISDDNGEDNWWPGDEDLYVDKKKKSRSRSRSSRGSIDWWLDGLSGELWRGRRNSHDSVSGEIAKSGGISSTPSMRGTVCYVAPEYGGAGNLSEKCDVYSYGVLLLVLIAGRRPLQVTGSPLSEFQRANLISWARHLARTGKLLDLVDKSIESLDQEQALIGITVALLCLQKSPARRPSMKEVVGMLSGESEPPQLPSEFSPSPPSRFPFKSRKKVR
ncbi:hypothetical protein L1049_020721 [Liquidambar formosana]|uniref:non-specific serine/threonine protein kinase n=1 Tax=Liquidambar formosana TaxID=63359 RepID=A0AAP0SDI3_LIQFO